MSLLSRIEPLIAVQHKDINIAIRLRAFKILLLGFWTALIIVNLVLILHFYISPAASFGWTTVVDLTFVSIMICVSYIFSIRGHLVPAVWAFIITLLIGTSIAQYARGEANAIIMIYPLTIFIAGLLLGSRSALICFILDCLTYFSTIQAVQIWGPYLEPNQSTMEMNNYLAVFASLFIVFLLTWLFTKNTRKYIEVLEVNNREKEVLLREIHHRVKNNLQIVSSLLNLQSDGLTDDHSKRILENSVGRIKSMALVHEKLYRSDNLSKIMLKDYFAGLLNYIGQSYQNQIEFKLDIDESELDIEQSLSLGLIVNELVTNSMKHAFNELPPDNERPNIIVRFRNIKGAMELCVHDNGRGMPDGSIINTSATLGLQLVKTLVDELEGTISVNSSSGTEIKIKFNHVGG